MSDNQEKIVDQLKFELKRKEDYIHYLEELRAAEQKVITLTQSELKEARQALAAHESVEQYMAVERQMAQAEIEAHKQVQALSQMEIRTQEEIIRAQEQLSDFAAKELVKKDSFLNRILSVNQSISATLQLTSLLQKILDNIIHTLRIERAVLFVEKKDEGFQPKAFYHLRETDIESDSFKQALLMIDAVQEDNKSKLWKNENDNQQTITSAVAVPLIFDNDLLGILYADIISGEYVLRNEDILLAEIFCSQAAISIHNARLYNKIKQQIVTDEFLGIPNRRKLQMDLDKNEKVSVALLNIDNFSFINGAHGNMFGDYVLKEVVNRISFFLLNKEDLYAATLYRLNSDEFIILSKKKKFPLFHLEQDIRYNLYLEPLIYENILLSISFSIGVVQNESEDLLRKANMALRYARLLGRGRAYVYNQNIDFIQVFQNKLFWANKVKSAIYYDKIVPYYQPIMDNRTGKVLKYECLMRMIDGIDIISPGKFIEAAKQIGRIPHLTIIMIEKTFELLKDADVELSINFSAEDLAIDNFFTFIKKRLEQTGINPSKITFEILEGISEEHDEMALEFIKELKSIGFKIAIDDFGKGYSNFSRILMTQADYIKIDGEFIKNINENSNSYKISHAITEFAHSIGIEVVAEFVHNDEIQQTVKDLGIEFSQGFYIGTPQVHIAK